MPLKVVGGINGSGTVGAVIEAIKYAENNGANICNISLGLRIYNEDLYNTMKNSEMLFVSSACNGDNLTNGVGYNLDSVKSYPACYDLNNQIVVGSMECDGTLHYNSNYSADYVDIVAPGTMVYSTSTEKSGFQTMTGTSMATAMVTGASALVLSSHSKYMSCDVKEAVINSAKHFDGLIPFIKNGNVLDIYSAVNYILISETTTAESTTITDSTEPTTAKSLVNRTEIVLKSISTNFYVKGKTQIKATVKNGVGKTTYKTNNPKIAKVSSTGCVTALKKGTAKITVANNNVSKILTVKVLNPSLNKTTVKLKKTKSFVLKIKGKIGTAKFKSSVNKVATVSKNGKVTAKKKGCAVITVKTNGIILKCKVKVK